MNKGVNSMISTLNKFADTEEAFDVQHIANLATLDVICGKKTFNTKKYAHGT